MSAIPSDRGKLHSELNDAEIVETIKSIVAENQALISENGQLRKELRCLQSNEKERLRRKEMAENEDSVEKLMSFNLKQKDEDLEVVEDAIEQVNVQYMELLRQKSDMIIQKSKIEQDVVSLREELKKLEEHREDVQQEIALAKKLHGETNNKIQFSEGLLAELEDEVKISQAKLLELKEVGEQLERQSRANSDLQSTNKELANKIELLVLEGKDLEASNEALKIENEKNNTAVQETKAELLKLQEERNKEDQVLKKIKEELLSLDKRKEYSQQVKEEIGILEQEFEGLSEALEDRKTEVAKTEVDYYYQNRTSNSNLKLIATNCPS